MSTPQSAHTPDGTVRQRLVSGGIWTLLNRVSVMLTMLAISALLGRLLTPDEVGAYFLIANLTAVAAVVAQFGLPQSVVRLVADAIARDQPGRARDAVRHAMRLGWIGAAIMAALLWFGGGQWLAVTVFDSPLMAGAIGLTILWMAAQLIQHLQGEVYRGLHDLRMAAIFGGMITGWLSVIMLAGMALWSGGHLDLHTVLTVTVISFVASSALAVVSLSRRTARFKGAGSITPGEILTLSAPMFVASITNILLLRADLWIYGMYASDADVAIYGAASRLIVLVATPLVMASAILAPMIAQLHARNENDKLERILRVVATLGGMPALFVLTLCFVFGDVLLSLIYGREIYVQGWSVLVILGIGQLVNVWSGVCAQLLIMTGRQKAVMSYTVLAALVSISLAPLLVVPFGMNGVAAAFAAGVIVQNVGMVLHARRHMGLRSYMYLNPLALRGLNLRELRPRRPEGEQRRPPR